MAEPVGEVEKKVIVIPRGLEDFFYERLTRRYAGRNDVTVLVDRRWGERRACEEAVFPDRRQGERRAATGAWSLPQMPFSTS